MKFNIFNEHTWCVEIPEDPEVKLLNKAQGAIGQAMNDVRRLKERILKAVKKSTDSVEYLYALRLKEENPKAFAIMEVVITHASAEVQSNLEKIDYILSSWNDVEGRRYKWREIAKKIQELKPLLEEQKVSWQTPIALNNLVESKVSGNAAWDLYLTQVRNNGLLNEDEGEDEGEDDGEDEDEDEDDYYD